MDGGWGQYAIILPDQDAAVVMLSDMTNSGYALEAFEKYLLPALDSAEFLPDAKLTLPHLKSLSPIGNARPASILKNGHYNFPDGHTLVLNWTDTEICLICDGEVFRVGLHGTWIENSHHMLVTPCFSIDCGVFGVPLESCQFSGAWESPTCLSVVGKSLGEMGEYYYRLEFDATNVTLTFTPKMCHNISTLDDSVIWKGVRNV